MTDFAPAYDVGDLVTPLSMSTVMTYRQASGATPIPKGSPVILSAGITDGTAIATIAANGAADDPAVIGVAMETSAPNDGAATPLTTANSVVPVIMHGITKVKTTTAITLGRGVVTSATAGEVRLTAIAAFDAQHTAMHLGYALSAFAADNDLGLIYVVK